MVIGRILRRNAGRRAVVLSALLLLVFTGLVSSCGAKKEEVTKDCKVGNDQKGTMSGHWTVKPVPLAVIVNDFNSVELSQIRGAIGTWNSFFTASKGFKLFLASGAPLSTVPSSTAKISTSSVCSIPSMVTSSGFSQPIVIQKVVSGWNHGGGIIALTGTCPNTVSGQTYKVYSAGVIEVNYQDFFATGLPQPDLQSVLLHELGHLLGLGHSCEQQATQGKPACSGSPQEYLQAVMFPSLGFDGKNGRVKRSLQQNDQQRVNCLY